MKSSIRLAVSITLMLTMTSRAQDLHLACYNGDLETVTEIISEHPDRVNALNSYGRFPLEMAAQTGQIDICRYLLASGADISRQRQGSTALHMAALYGGRTDLVLLLLEKGADINARTGGGLTPLDLAVMERQTAIADLLLDRGGEISPDRWESTRLLYLAASGGIERIVDLALTGDIDYSYRTETGRTLLHSAAEGDMIRLASTLLAGGVDTGAADCYGVTPLHLAAGAGDLKMTALLLENGADLDSRMMNGKTPLHIARENGREDCQSLLIQKGADTTEWTFPVRSGHYLNQPPPGKAAVMFAPGIVSEQDQFEHSCLAFSPDYSEVYWSTDMKERGFYDIVYMKREKGGWTPPRLAPFSERYHAGNPVFACDGQRLYFSSSRPGDAGTGGSDVNIWVVDKTGDGWSAARPLDESLNTEQNESVLGITRTNTLYFRRGTDLYNAEWSDHAFQAPEKLDLELPGGTGILSLFIDPDERYMVMESFGGGEFGGGDLYACFKRQDGSWSAPVNLGPSVNSAGHERFPVVTPDGKYLIFCRVTDGSDFFWVDAGIIEEMRLKHGRVFR
ncbi:ankyrin repeat domain-containing protein [bacterium]|nr:ankyrin repeat domain-containing protein [bacterium]